MSPSGPGDSDARQSRRLVAGLMIALALWGIYLAVGATGVFVDTGLLDLRKSLIVLGCSAAFLVFWLVPLGVRSRRTGLPVSDHQWSWASGLSLAGTLLAFLLWLATARIRQIDGPAKSIYTLGGLAAGLFAVATILALIGASDPRPRRGKSLALLTLLLLGVAVVVLLCTANGENLVFLARNQATNGSDLSHGCGSTPFGCGPAALRLRDSAVKTLPTDR